MVHANNQEGRAGLILWLTYEELLADVECPGELAEALEAIWAPADGGDAHGGRYAVVADAAGHEEEASASFSLDGSMCSHEDNGEPFPMDRTLAHTLYRFTVLFGLPAAGDLETVPEWGKNPVLRALYGHLDNPSGKVPACLRTTGGATTGGRKSQKREPGQAPKAVARRLAAAFAAHRAAWGLECGSAAPMALARGRLERLGGLGLLQSMMAFDPAARPPLAEVLRSELFAPLRSRSRGFAGGAAEAAAASDHAFLKYL